MVLAKLLELKVPPVALVIIFAFLMYALDKLVPMSIDPTSWHIALAIISVIAGVVIAIAGVRAFKKAKTTVNPMTPEKSSELVVQGIYQRTRNPMYVGFLLALAGWGLLLNNPFSLLLCIGFVIYMNKFQIEPEEQALTELFGEQFTQYKNKVSRWL